MKDFDALRKEKWGKGATYKMLGKTYQLPPALPAKLGLFVAEAEGKNEIKGDLLRSLCYETFGKENVDGWLESGIYLEELESLFEWAMIEMTGKNLPAPQEKDAASESTS